MVELDLTTTFADGAALMIDKRGSEDAA